MCSTGSKSNVSIGRKFGFLSGILVVLQLNGSCWSWVGPAMAVKFSPGKEYLDAILASKAPYLKNEKKMCYAKSSADSNSKVLKQHQIVRLPWCIVIFHRIYYFSMKLSNSGLVTV